MESNVTHIIFSDCVGPFKNVMCKKWILKRSFYLLIGYYCLLLNVHCGKVHFKANICAVEVWIPQYNTVSHRLLQCKTLQALHYNIQSHIATQCLCYAFNTLCVIVIHFMLILFEINERGNISCVKSNNKRCVVLTQSFSMCTKK